MSEEQFKINKNISVGIGYFLYDDYYIIILKYSYNLNIIELKKMIFKLLDHID